MNQDLAAYLRDNIVADFEAIRQPASRVWQQVMKQPKDTTPSPQQQFSDFMKMDQKERVAMAQEMGAENYAQFTDEMVNIGVEVMGQPAEAMRQYFAQDLAGLELANRQEQEYTSLIEQALANPMIGMEDASIQPEIPPTADAPAGI